MYQLERGCKGINDKRCSKVHSCAKIGKYNNLSTLDLSVVCQHLHHTHQTFIMENDQLERRLEETAAKL